MGAKRNGMHKVEEALRVVQKENRKILPIFVTFTEHMPLEKEHEPIKKIVERLKSLWNTYLNIYEKMEQCYRMEMMEEENIPKNKAAEIESNLCILLNASSEITDKITKLGGYLSEKIDVVEKIEFFKKFKEFNYTHNKLTEISTNILLININKLTPSQKESLTLLEYKLYKCLILSESIQEQKKVSERDWVVPKKYKQLRMLYNSCYFSLSQYLTTYRMVTKSIAQQNTLLNSVDHANTICLGFLDQLMGVFQPDRILEMHQSIYNGSIVEEKIIHHENSIQRRKQSIESILREHKKAMQEINQLNWKVGKEAKNIANMEKTHSSRGEISIKRLFFLFEDLERSLKKAEQTLVQYNKLVVNTKKNAYTRARLFTIKSLDFNYLIIEGDLLSLKEDLQVIYNASKEIYREHSNIIGM